MRVIGQESIASVFGVAPKTIVEWQEQGFPVALRGKPGVPSEYETCACIAWMVERELRKVRDESPKDRLARVTADKIEMENAKTRGLLVPADEIEPKLRAAFVLARETWLDQPPQLARAAEGKKAEEIEALLELPFAKFLLQLSRWHDADVEDEEGDDE